VAGEVGAGRRAQGAQPAGGNGNAQSESGCGATALTSGGVGRVTERGHSAWGRAGVRGMSSAMRAAPRALLQDACTRRESRGTVRQRSEGPG
jgi:hypothetical protein